MLAIYTRLSKEDTTSASIDNQLKEGKLFASKNGFNDYKLYNEGEGISGGAEIKDRPQLFKLLQDINNKEISIVWFRNQNRLERSSNTWHIFTSEAKKYNVSIYFGDKLFDFENPQDNLYGTIQSALNQYQKDLQSTQTKRVLRMKVKEGWAGSNIPFGYTKDENTMLVVDEMTSKVVVKMFKDSLAGIGTRAIAKGLNDLGITSSRGTKFSSNTIYTILKNETYKGLRHYGGEVFSSPIIVDVELFDKVQANFKAKNFITGKKVEHKFPLRGLLRCGKCDNLYFGYVRNNRKDKYYICASKRTPHSGNCGSRSLHLPILESLIWNTVIREGKLKEHIIKQHSNLATNRDNNKLVTKRDSLNKELISIDKKILNAFDLMTNTSGLNDDTRVLFSSKISTMQTTQKGLKNELKAIKEELIVFNEMSKDIGKKLEGFDKIKNYKKLTHQLKKDSLNEVIKYIQVIDLKDTEHTYLAIVPKLGYEVEPMVVIMNYDKDYAVILTGDKPFVWNISKDGLKEYKKINMGAILFEMQAKEEEMLERLSYF